MRNKPDDGAQFGPLYPEMPAMNKWRAIGRERALTAAENAAAAATLFKSIAALKRKEAMVGLHFPGPRETQCASGYPYGERRGHAASTSALSIALRCIGPVRPAATPSWPTCTARRWPRRGRSKNAHGGPSSLPSRR